ncbi:MAG: alpha/beta fold hydrolase [Planctomycetaceae bacterium]
MLTSRDVVPGIVMVLLLSGPLPCSLAQPWSLENLQSPPEMKWLDEASPIRSLTYCNEKFQGQETDVFAFYATPGTISGDPSQDRNLPAVVLIHGGGGTAFAEWVWLWAQRGYAAIAMDLSGRRPSAPVFDPETRELLKVRSQRQNQRTRLEHGGPEHGQTEKFGNVGGDLTDDWQFHAVPAVIRAHSLIRSFREVNADRTAVTGISWGGYLTCLVASVDHRFKAAVPVYGCGFLYDGESVQRPAIDRLEPEQRREWIHMYDPSAWLSRCRVPIFFVNGTNDKHYPLVSYSRSFDLVNSPKQIRIEVNMRHSHSAGWEPAEIARFIDQHLRQGEPLPKFGKLRFAAGRVMVDVQSKLDLKNSRLHYTAENGPLVARRWQSNVATLAGQTVSARVPENAKIWMLSVTDARDGMVTTDIMLAE